MSLCSNTVRAWSRSRPCTSKTLLPFLYQTATIQQWKPTTRPAACRGLHSRSHDGDDIPFEGEDLPPPVVEEPPRKTTITGTERAAFRKLYRTVVVQKDKDFEPYRTSELTQATEEHYEGEEPSDALGKVFDDVLKGKPRARRSRAKPESTPKSTLESTPEGPPTMRGPRVLTPWQQDRILAEKAGVAELRLADMERFNGLLKNVQSDRELWQLLEREAFEPVDKLDLDNMSKYNDDRKRPKPFRTKRGVKRKDQHVLFDNFPHYLNAAVATLRTDFPASPLPFSILPTVKALGRSAYALGATTLLYTQLIRTAWIQQSSYTYIDALLTDMDNSAIEFDADLLALLVSIIKEHSWARDARLGNEMQKVYTMQQVVDDFAKISDWRDRIAEKLYGAGAQLNSARPVRRARHAGVDNFVAPRFDTMGPDATVVVRRVPVR